MGANSPFTRYSNNPYHKQSTPISLRFILKLSSHLVQIFLEMFPVGLRVKMFKALTFCNCGYIPPQSSKSNHPVYIMSMVQTMKFLIVSDSIIKCHDLGVAETDIDTPNPV